MKGKNSLKLICIAIVIVVFAYVALFGLSIGDYKIIPVKDAVKLGLDLKGGVYVVLEASEADGQEVTSETMDKAIETIRGRVDQMGVTEPVIVKEGDKRIRVELADVENPEEAIEMIGKTAMLQFIDPDGNVVITGSNVKSASAGYAQDSYGVDQPVVSLELDEEGTKKFAEATEKYYGQVISIMLDDQAISEPTVSAIITNGKAQISGSKDINAASQLAILIRAGALPVELTEVQSSTVGPTLGQDSLSKSLIAGICGIGLLFVFMILFYRLPGVIASVTLVVYILIVMLVMVSINAVLTLQGIAGLILSVGMAVDANVIIFERIKEEIRNGKSIRASVDAGFKRAFRTILDSNITTLIAAAALYYFGSGTVKGFALTLGIGIVVSMLTAILLTRVILKTTANIKAFQNPFLFGVSEGGKLHEN